MKFNTKQHAICYLALKEKYENVNPAELKILHNRGFCIYKDKKNDKQFPEKNMTLFRNMRFLEVTDSFLNKNLKIEF